MKNPISFVRASSEAMDGKEPPSEFRLFKFGQISTTKGEFNFSPEACDLLLEERAQHDAELQIDYDHLAIEAKSPGDGKAAGWFKLEKRDDGLWAVNVRWTPAAAKMLRDGEYRYFSPYFGATKDTHTIVCLMNCAITNIPAMHEINALVAASRRELEKLGLDAVACVIKKEGGKYNLYDSTGKKLLGSHDSKAKAQAQESAINISKARKAGHPIPKKGKDEVPYEGKEETMAEQHGEKITLGQYLARKMKEHGMSMKSLAEKAGMEEDRLRAVHDGEDATPEEMASLGKSFGMKEGEFENELEKCSAFDNQDPDQDDRDDGEDEPEPKKASRSAKDRNQGKAKPSRKVAASREEDDDVDEEKDELYLEMVELTGTTDRSEHRKALRNVFAAAAKAPQMAKQLEAITAKADEQRREMLIDQGKKEGKLTPSLIRFYAKRPTSELEGFLAAAPTLSTQSLMLREGEGEQVAAILTREEIEVCRMTRFSPDKLAKFVAERNSGKAAQAIADSYYA